MKIQQLFKGVESRDDAPLILDRLNAKCICEVGVRKGEYFDILTKGRNLKMAVAVDIWENFMTDSQNDTSKSRHELGIIRNIFELKFKDTPGLIIAHSFSGDAVHAFIDEMFDFIYIDADHTYHEAKKDLMEWFKKVRPGGVIGGHDYNSVNRGSVHFEVKRAVDDFIDYYGLQDNIHFTKESTISYYIMKPE